MIIELLQFKQFKTNSLHFALYNFMCSDKHVLKIN